MTPGLELVIWHNLIATEAGKASLVGCLETTVHRGWPGCSVFCFVFYVPIFWVGHDGTDGGVRGRHPWVNSRVKHYFHSSLLSTCYISCVFISEEGSISIDAQFFWPLVHFENLIKVTIQCTSALNPKIRQARSGVHEISAAHPSSSSQCWECPDSTHWWVKYWRRWEISTNVHFSCLRWILGTF